MIIRKAYAKINLTLNITGRREDGYHTLDTIMQTVSLWDVVKIEKAGGISVECGNLSGRENIACKAAEAFFAHTGKTGGTRITIEKKIPAGGGLGGGSADAASVLRGLNILYNANLSNDGLRQIAAALGADVPFLIEGGTAYCTGIGEKISPVKFSNPSLAYCVCYPGVSASTRVMFEEIDKHNIQKCDSQKMLEALKRNDISGITASLHNDFLPVCRELIPQVGELEKLLYENNALGVSLSGSGSSLFGVFDSFEKAKQAEENIKAYAFARAVTTVNC